MSLKKYLRSSIRNCGQSLVEYFVLLTIIASLAVFGSSTFFARSQNVIENFTIEAANAMLPDTEE